MRMSRALIPTQKDSPRDIQIESHQLLLRSGMIHPAGGGGFIIMPAGMRVLNKLTELIAGRLLNMGAQEVSLPGLTSLEGDDGGGSIFSRNAGLHRAVAQLAAVKVESGGILPLMLFHRGWRTARGEKLRGGLLRSREYFALGGYGLYGDKESLDDSFEEIAGILHDYLAGLDLNVLKIISGGISETIKFAIPSSQGDEEILQCPGCGYSADPPGTAPSAPSNSITESSPGQGEYREVHTPGVTTIDSLSRVLNIPADQIIKSMVFIADGNPVMALVPGNRDLNPFLLRKAIGAGDLRQGDEKTIQSFTGGPVGFSGPVGIDPVRIIQDEAIPRMKATVTGANRRDYHLTGVVPGLHFNASTTASLATARDGDGCPRCGKPLESRKVFSVAKLEKTDDYYTAPAGAMVESHGNRRVMLMNCFSLGLTRLLGVMAQENRDKNGLIWPHGVAPYQAVITVVNYEDPLQRDVSDRLYRELTGAGIHCLLDDRDRRPGFKFKDAELLGIPVMVVVGRKTKDEGLVEIKIRKTGGSELCPVDAGARKVFETLGGTFNRTELAMEGKC